MCWICSIYDFLLDPLDLHRGSSTRYSELKRAYHSHSASSSRTSNVVENRTSQNTVNIRRVIVEEDDSPTSSVHRRHVRIQRRLTLPPEYSERSRTTSQAALANSADGFHKNESSRHLTSLSQKDIIVKGRSKTTPSSKQTGSSALKNSATEQSKTVINRRAASNRREEVRRKLSRHHHQRQRHQTSHDPHGTASDSVDDSTVSSRSVSGKQPVADVKKSSRRKISQSNVEHVYEEYVAADGDKTTDAKGSRSSTKDDVTPETRRPVDDFRISCLESDDMTLDQLFIQSKDGIQRKC